MKLETLEINIHDCIDYDRLYWSKKLVINSNQKTQKAFYSYFHGIEYFKLKKAISILKENEPVETRLLEINYNRRKVLCRIIEESENYYIIQKEYTIQTESVNKKKENIRVFTKNLHPYILKNKTIHIFNHNSNTYYDTKLSETSFLNSLNKIEKVVDFFNNIKEQVNSL